MIKISIITINYNNLEGLKKTMASVFNQTFLDFEYLVIDGGSTDGSAEYIESQSDNIDYWVSEADRGIYNAMNKGVSKASGEYLLFLNSGDHFFNDEVLKENIHYLEHYDLIYFNQEVMGKEGAEIRTLPSKLRFSDLFFNSWPHNATFIKKTLFEKVGLYDESLKIVSDWKFFMLALFNHHCSYIKINATLSTFYLGGISTGMECVEEANRFLEEYYSEYTLDYDELKMSRELLKTNRIKMLLEIEKSVLGQKMVSILFRVYIILFTKKKLKDLIH